MRENSKVSVEMELKTKGAAYFQGEISKEFAVFGSEGKVTGALQRGTGKVSTTIQMVARSGTSAVTTSFNLVGVINKEGVYSGTFSATEISRNAGNCSGLFKGKRAEKSESEVEDEKEEEKVKSPAAAKKTAAAAAAAAEEDDEEEEEKKKAAAKAAAKEKKRKEEEEAAAAAASPTAESTDADEAAAKAKRKEEKRLAKQKAAEEEAAAEAAAAAEAEAEAQAAVSAPLPRFPAPQHPLQLASLSSLTHPLHPHTQTPLPLLTSSPFFFVALPQADKAARKAAKKAAKEAAAAAGEEA